jgi:hypothetical protein
MFVKAKAYAEDWLPVAKRIIAGILGSLAVFGSLLPLGYAYEILKDFGNPEVSFWPNVGGELLFCLIAVAGFWTGLRFLRFAASGESQQSGSWVKPLLLGIGSFFPGFVFSLPINIFWMSHTWPGDDGKLDLAFGLSAGVGVATSIICTILLFRKRVVSHTP